MLSPPKVGLKHSYKGLNWDEPLKRKSYLPDDIANTPPSEMALIQEAFIIQAIVRNTIIMILLEIGLIS